jgi:hypothetical protein
MNSDTVFFSPILYTKRGPKEKITVGNTIANHNFSGLASCATLQRVGCSCSWCCTQQPISLHAMLCGGGGGSTSARPSLAIGMVYSTTVQDNLNNNIFLFKEYYERSKAGLVGENVWVRLL